MPPHRWSHRVGDDYERVPNVPGEYRRKQATRHTPGGKALTLYTPPHRSFGRIELLEKLAEVRTLQIRLDLVGTLKRDAKYEPDGYSGGVTYLSRNIPYTVPYLYELIKGTTDTGWRIRDLLNSLTDFEFVVIDEVRFTERGPRRTAPIVAKRLAEDKRAGRV